MFDSQHVKIFFRVWLNPNGGFQATFDCETYASISLCDLTLKKMDSELQGNSLERIFNTEDGKEVLTRHNVPTDLDEENIGATETSKSQSAENGERSGMSFLYVRLSIFLINTNLRP